MRSPWEFDYAPVARDKSEAESDFDMIVATERAIEPAELGAAVGNHRMIERVLELPPLHWLRVRSEHPVGLREIEAKLRDAGLPVRYVASAHRPSTRVTAAANFAATSMPTPSPTPTASAAILWVKRVGSSAPTASISIARCVAWAAARGSR
jgi:hypothetical protein